MQTALHIYSLTHELNDTIIGATFSAAEFYKKEREAFIYFTTGEGTFALGLAYHPVGYGVFLIPAGKVDTATKEKPWPFFQPSMGGKVVSVRQLGLDRIIKIEIDKDNTGLSIIAEAIGPNGNLWLLDSGDHILATLRHKKFAPSEKYTAPSRHDRLNPFRMAESDLADIFKSADKQTIDYILRKSIIGLDEFLVGEILRLSGIERSIHVDSVTNSNLKKLNVSIKEIAGRFESYHQGYIYETAAGRAAYPFKLEILSPESKEAKTLSLAIYAAIKSKKEARSDLSEKQKVLELVEKIVLRLERKAARIKEDMSDADRYDEYKKYAELLKINLPKIKKGANSIDLTDIYAGDNKTIHIPLDPALTGSENAGEYFKKYRKAKDKSGLLERRLEVAQKELASSRKMEEDFYRDYETAVNKYQSEIAGLLPRDEQTKTPAPRLPYKVFTLSTGITIYVGRDGDDNDRTTFGFAKPYELWFHAAQCPGSHVVMKFPDKNFKPSKQEIAETAAMAAYHSKAKNSRTVAVIYTERRYVRKPRKAKAGLVTVEREKMVMVAPKKVE